MLPAAEPDPLAAAETTFLTTPFLLLATCWPLLSWLLLAMGTSASLLSTRRFLLGGVAVVKDSALLDICKDSWLLLD